MTVSFIHSGQKVFIDKSPEGVRTPTLKAALYTIEYTREEGFFLLEIGDKYNLPEKMYGDHKSAAERVIKTHQSKKGSTGVLLSGLKGTGKSLFVKVISNRLIELGVPVIQINKPYPGTDLFNIIENAGVCALVFDEFGKNYSVYNGGSGPTQAGLLTLLDGLTNSKRIHLFTENSLDDISNLLINRPGRVHYHFKYDRLSSKVIQELCEDNQLPKEVIKELIELSSRLKVLSFDIVKCLIDEWKLYGGKLEELLKTLNITLCSDPDNKDVEVVSFVTLDGQNIDPKYLTVKKITDRLTVESLSAPEFKQDIYLNLYIGDAVKIVEDVYHFIEERGFAVSIRIRNPY